MGRGLMMSSGAGPWPCVVSPVARLGPAPVEKDGVIRRCRFTTHKWHNCNPQAPAATQGCLSSTTPPSF